MEIISTDGKVHEVCFKKCEPIVHSNPNYCGCPTENKMNRNISVGKIKLKPDARQGYNGGNFGLHQVKNDKCLCR